MSWRPILTAQQMRAAEAQAIAAGIPVGVLMDRAGTAAAKAIRLYSGPLPALVLCGPGNNGGDGYVIARILRECGVEVRLAAFGLPASDAAKAARDAWGGAVEDLADADPAPLLVDALFGTGLARPLDERVSTKLLALAVAAKIRVAIDLPSGAATDDGALLSPVPRYDLTITFATLKPSHRLQPAAAHMGRVVIADIGVEAASRLHEIGSPSLRCPSARDHKYSRGYVAVIAGAMPGASALTAAAAMRAAAGYVRLIGPDVARTLPGAIVQDGGDPERLLADSRIGAVAVGPGLGRDARAEMLVDIALASGRPLVLDADALTLVSARGAGLLRNLPHIPILTPHAGEYARLFPDHAGSKVEQARQAAAETGAVVIYKGADTVVAHPDGRAAIAPPSSPWLASAGTGDVLTGIVAAMRAARMEPFEAARAGVWLHNRAAGHAGPALIADDLIAHLPAAIADFL